jgi:Asp/Glu/hydantoin racemase
VVELPWAADCCPCVEKLRTVLPLTVGIRDGAVHLVSTLGSAVISARAELGSIIEASLRRLMMSGGCCGVTCTASTSCAMALQRTGGAYSWSALRACSVSAAAPSAAAAAPACEANTITVRDGYSV